MDMGRGHDHDCRPRARVGGSLGPAMPDMMAVRDLAESVRARYSYIGWPEALDVALRAKIAEDFLVNWQEPEQVSAGRLAVNITRVNFLFAHEVGHWAMFREFGDVAFLPLAAHGGEVPSADGGANRGTRAVERMCDVFAAAFLIPAPAAFTFLAETTGVYEDLFRYLSREYLVADTQKGGATKEVLRYPQTVVWPAEQPPPRARFTNQVN
jgi:hypothetical protein